MPCELNIAHQRRQPDLNGRARRASALQERLRDTLTVLVITCDMYRPSLRSGNSRDRTIEIIISLNRNRTAGNPQQPGGSAAGRRAFRVRPAV